MPMASAPPLPPSPVITAMIGVVSPAMSFKLRAIAVQLDEVVEEQLAPVARVRALGMARQQRALPGGQAGVGALAQARQPLLEPRDLVAHARGVVHGLERGDARLQLQQRLLEVKRVRHARSP